MGFLHACLTHRTRIKRRLIICKIPHRTTHPWIRNSTNFIIHIIHVTSRALESKFVTISELYWENYAQIQNNGKEGESIIENEEKHVKKLTPTVEQRAARITWNTLTELEGFRERIMTLLFTLCSSRTMRWEVTSLRQLNHNKPVAEA